MKGFLPNRLPPFANLLLLVGLMFGTFCIAGFFIMVAGYWLFDLGAMQMGNVTQNPTAYPQGWAFSMVSQGVLLFVGFAGAALALASLTGYRWADYFAPHRPARAWWLLAAGALVILSVPFMSVLISWNAQAHLPAGWHGWEVSAREMEDKAQTLTQFLTRFNSPLRFWIGVLVIAVVPAISEELVFRGVVQRNLVEWFGSRHVGVWLAAAVFSAIHFQFFGFLPRFVLGLGLGYLYEWSKNILVPMAAHFTQNCFQLILLYWQQQHWVSTDFDPDSTDSMPWPLVLLSVLLVAGLLYYLHQHLTADDTAERLPTQLRTLSRHGISAADAAAQPPSARTIGRDGINVNRFRPDR